MPEPSHSSKAAPPLCDVECDVAIVGGGPVGALAANLLGRAGLSVVVLERDAAPYALPRAVHIDHEMIRIFQGLGLAGRLLPLMREAQGHLHLGADGGVIRYMGAAGRPKPFGWANDYFLYQPELEAELRLGLAGLPKVALMLGAEVVGLRQDLDGVSLDVDIAGRWRGLRARFVIGCDGARSTVRRSIGVRLDDLQFDAPWLVVDVQMAGPIRFPAIAGLPAMADLQALSVMVCDPRRPCTVVPGRGDHRRWEFMLLPGESEAAVTRPEAVRALLEPWIGDAPHRIVRAACYRFHGLVAERWRAGRVLLAGDAAHQTPPFFGQGMCHGFRDVANLAWKLALVTQGRADPALLDSYQQERDPHVRSVIGAALAAGRYICELDPARAAARDAQLRAQMAGAEAAATAADLIPPYRAGVVGPGGGERFIHPRVRTGGTADRLLDDAIGPGFALLALDAASLENTGPATLARWEDLGGRSWTLDGGGPAGIEDTAGALAGWLRARDATALILRPDRYVYGVADGPAALAALIGRLEQDLRASPSQKPAAQARTGPSERAWV